MGMPGGAEWLVIFVVGVMVLGSAVLCCLIFQKTGFPWAMGLLVFVPFIGHVLVLCILAFTDWPVLRTLRRLQAAEA
ncbi:MAG TPA: twin-arginine translocase TatA/TatE family subunit [Phycisphaerales bacterium]|nr:twin-arginine translocase TatA/TatE family subunit [Phycisphaerales bacterium]